MTPLASSTAPSASEAVSVGRSRAGPKVAVIPLENFFSQISISRVGTCCPDTRQVFPGRLGMIGSDSKIDATW